MFAPCKTVKRYYFFHTFVCKFPVDFGTLYEAYVLGTILAAHYHFASVENLKSRIESSAWLLAMPSRNLNSA